MKVFVAGGTGVLGRRVIKLLTSTNEYKVIALARSQENEEYYKKNGIQYFKGDLFSKEDMKNATKDCDAVLHLATAIPPNMRDWKLNDRIRQEGAGALLEGVKGTNKLYVQQSVTFTYRDHFLGWVDENTPLAPMENQLVNTKSTVEMERMIQEANLANYAILRFGMFYSHDSHHVQQMIDYAKKGWFPIVGDGQSYWSSTHLDDAASSIFAVLERFKKDGKISGIYNVVDDKPATAEEVTKYMYSLVKPGYNPWRVPIWLFKLLLGPAANVTLDSLKVSNSKFKTEFNWTPEYPSYREGYLQIVDQLNK
jgi:nucleoside-diphosphate-sugar epimerase